MKLQFKNVKIDFTHKWMMVFFYTLKELNIKIRFDQILCPVAMQQLCPEHKQKFSIDPNPLWG